MNTPLHEQIDALHALREEIAALVKAQALRELDQRRLRAVLESEYRQKGSSATSAEREARSDERYLRVVREDIADTERRMLLEADAEAAVYSLQLQLGVLRREPVGA